VRNETEETLIDLVVIMSIAIETMTVVEIAIMTAIAVVEGKISKTVVEMQIIGIVRVVCETYPRKMIFLRIQGEFLKISIPRRSI
jgi:hypothetical protein